MSEQAAQQGQVLPTGKIRYPRKNQHLQHLSFFATGIASVECTHLLGVLHKDKTALRYLGKTLAHPPATRNWVIFFQVPYAEPRATYTLSLFELGIIPILLDIVTGIQLENGKGVG